MVRRHGGERTFGPVWRVIVWLVVAALLLPTWLRPGLARAQATGLLEGDEDAPIYVPAAGQAVLPATDANVELGSFTDPSGGNPWAVVVNWGDLTSATTFQMPIVGDLGTAPHRWTYGGTYQVTVKVTDSFGASDTGGFLVTVGNTVPDVPTNVAATPGNAAATVTWAPPFTDGGTPIDAYTVSIQPTAGGVPQTQQITDLGALTATFTGLANGMQYTAAVKAHNELGDGAATTTTVTPEAPVLAITGLDTTTLPEGSAAFALVVTGTGFAEGMVVRWEGSDRLTTFGSATELTAQITAEDVANSGSASVTVHDGTGEVTSNALTFTISNVAPSATFDAPATVGVGEAIALALSDATDPSPADTTAGFTYAFDCGSGSGYGAFGATSTASCPTSANGQRTVKGKVRDQDGGEREYTKTVEIVELPAATLAVATASGPYNGTAALSATLTLDDEPLVGKTVSFVLVGTAVGSATTDEGGIATLPSASLAGIDVGTYPSGVVATYAGESGQHLGDSGTAALTVTKANQTITFAVLPDRELAVGSFEVSATSSSGLTVAFYASGSCTIDGTTVTLVALGGCTITASQIGSMSYNGAQDVVRSFQVTPPASGLTTQAATGSYGGTTTLTATLLDSDDQPLADKLIAFTIDGTSVGSAATNESGVATLPNVSLDGIAAGSHPDAIGASFAGDDDFAASEDTAALTIEQTALTVTAANKSRAVGAANPTFTATYDGFVDDETVAELGGALDCTTTATNASVPGTYPITCTGHTSTNYAISYVAGTLTIVAGDSVIDADAVTVTYGAANATFSATITAAIAVNEGTVTFTVKQEATILGSVTSGTVANGEASATFSLTGLGAGEYSIVADYSGGTSFNASSDTATLTIGKADQQITFAALANRQLNASPFIVSATASSGLAVVFAASGGACTVAATSVTLTGIGTCTLTANQAGNANYNAAAAVARSFQVTANPPAQVTLALTVVGVGAVYVAPPGVSSAGGDYGVAPGDVVVLTAQPGQGQTFIGWAVDGVVIGWATSLSITMESGHAVQAQYLATTTFPDVDSARDDFAAIAALASRGTILGYLDGRYGPDDLVSRAQMAALIARATPAGPGTPTNGTLTPPNCVAPDSWDCEDWGNDFADRGELVASLWRNIGTLQHYGVASGYDGVNFGPNDEVTYAQTIAFITRAMVAKGYWQWQPNGPTPPAGVPSGHDRDVRTFLFYAGSLPGLPEEATWNDGATRGWFAQALWTALDSYWGTDDLLPDGEPAGGYVP